MSGAFPVGASGATIRIETYVDVPPAFAWEAIRDVGAVHTRQARGFVVDTVLREDVRTVTFVKGIDPPVVKERIVSIDDDTRRLAYGAIETRAAFHSASLQVLADGGGSRLVWLADILPAAFKDLVRRNMELGMAAMKKTLEEDARKR